MWFIDTLDIYISSHRSRHTQKVACYSIFKAAFPSLNQPFLHSTFGGKSSNRLLVHLRELHREARFETHDLHYQNIQASFLELGLVQLRIGMLEYRSVHSRVKYL